jgi:O-antigen/teichoic acid export membrane protein
MTSINRLVGSTIYLYIDNLVVAGGNWLYWIIISRLTDPSSVGQATPIISLVIFLTTVIQLGTEYPLLQRTSKEGSVIIGPAIIMTLILTCSTIPILTFIMIYSYGNLSPSLIWIGVIMTIFFPLDFVSRYALLGVSMARLVTIIDISGVFAKFGLAFFLLINGAGAYAILLSLLLQVVSISIANLIMVDRVIGIRFTRNIMNLARGIMTQSLINTPSKLSGMLIFSLSVVLLAAFGIDSSDIGRFYIALMISVVASGLLSSMAYMVIPVSASSNKDLSNIGLRVGLALTSPLIAILICSPGLLLSFFGPEYIKAIPIMVILSIGILPFSVNLISISRFNILGSSRKILLIGLLQIISFILSFGILVPRYGTIGAATSIVISFIFSFAVTILWIERNTLKLILKSVAAIVIGSLSGIAASSIIQNQYLGTLTGSVIAIALTFMLLIILKNITTHELSSLLRIAAREK